MRESARVRYPVDPSKFAQGIEVAIPEFGVAKAAGRHDANMGRLPVMEVEGRSIGNTRKEIAHSVMCVLPCSEVAIGPSPLYSPL